MSIGFHRLLAGAVLALAHAQSGAASVEHDAALLFGLEYEDIPPGSAIGPGASSCIEQETRPVRVGGQDWNGWHAVTARCGDRTVELLKRRISGQEGRPARWRIEDVLLLPPFPVNGARYLARQGDCAITDAPGTSFVALLRRRASGTPAIEQLWTYDLEQGRMQRQPAARLECSAAAG